MKQVGEEEYGYSERAFLDLHHGMPELPLRAQQCVDCAVACGMYQPISDSLARCPEATQRFVSARWFCHETPGYACRGNTDNVARRGHA